jgi:hypothetical protein
MPRAYVLIEAPFEKTTSVRNALGSLGNCKALVEALWPGELVVHIEGNDPDSLHDGLTRQLPAIDGVTRMTVWSITNRS